MADGKVTIETALDSSGLQKGLGLIKGAIAALGMGALAKDIIDTGKSFDTSMSQVQATMGITRDHMSELNGESVNTMSALQDLAIQMGSETAFSATQCSDALNYLALAGYDTQQMADTLPTVLNLAAAGGMELATASDMVTDAMSALGMDTKDASKMVDQMAKTASSSNTSVSQLGEAILTVGGTAKTMKGGTVELSTALGILANNGIKGAEGGTHLRNILLSLQAPTDKAAEAMEALGVNAYDANGDMRPLNDIMKDLNKSMEGMTSAEKQKIISTIFNKTDLAAADALLSNCTDSWDELAEAIENSGGAAEQMANTQLDNLEGQLTLMQSALEGFKLSLWENMRDPLKDMATIATDAITSLTSAFNTGGMSALAECGINLILQLINGAISKIPELFSIGTQALLGLLNGLQSFMPQLIQTGSNALQSIIQGIIQNGPALITAAANTIASFVQGIAGQLPTLIPQGIQMILTLAASIVENIPTIVQAGISLIGGLVEGIVSSIPEVIQQAPQIINDFWNTFDESALQLVQAGWNAIKNLVQGIIDNIPLIIENAGQIVGAIATTIMHLDLLSMGKTLFTNLGEGIRSMGPNIMAKAKEVGMQGLNAIKNIDWLGLGRSVIDFLRSGISGMGSTIMSALKTIGTTALNAFKGIDWAGLGRAVLNFIVNGIRALGSIVSSALKSIGSSAMSAFRGISWSSVGSAVINGIVSGITGAAGALFGALRSLASNALSAAKSALGIHSPSREFERQVGKFIPSGVAVGVDKNKDMLLDSIDSMSEEAVAEAKEMSDDLSDAMVPSRPDLSGYLGALKDMLFIGQTDFPTVKQAQRGLDLSYSLEKDPVAERMGEMLEEMRTLRDEMKETASATIEAIRQMKVMMDRKEVAEIIAPEIDEILGIT